MEFRLKDVSITVDEVNGRKIGGYVNVTQRESEILYSKKRNMYFKEIMTSGVFQESLNEGRNIPLLYEHDWNKQLADLRSGTLTLKEDQIGLRFDAVINDDKVYEEVKKGRINSCSFGFIVLEDKIEPINSRLEKRIVTKIKLEEVSLVSNPAYVGSLCEARSLQEELSQEELKDAVEETPADATRNEEDIIEKVMPEDEELDMTEEKLDILEDQAELDAKKEAVAELGNQSAEITPEMIKQIVMEVLSEQERAKCQTEPENENREDNEDLIANNEEVETQEEVVEDTTEEKIEEEEEVPVENPQKRNVNVELLKLRMELIKLG